MTASCLLPASATYRNTHLMDSLLSYFSSRRHTVFSESVITVVYCHSTFYLALTSTQMDLHWLESHDGELCPLLPRTNYSSLHETSHHVTTQNLVLVFCICFNCSIKYVYTRKMCFNLSGFTASQQCNRIVVENSRVQQGSEGVYEKIDAVICSVRPVYQQIWPNFLDRYIVFGWTYHKWLIGPSYEYCNETNKGPMVSLIVQDVASSPDKVTQT